MWKIVGTIRRPGCGWAGSLCDPWAVTLTAHHIQHHQTLTKWSRRLGGARRIWSLAEGSRRRGREWGKEEDEGPRVGEAAVRVLQGGEAPGHRLHPLHRQPQAQAAPGLLHHRRSRRVMPPAAASQRLGLRLRRGVRGVRNTASLPRFLLLV